MSGRASGPWTTGDIDRAYDAIAPHYDGWDALPEALGVGRLRCGLVGQARGEVLDVATGTGKNLGYIPRGCRVTAIDASQAMLDLAHEHAGYPGLNAAFLTGDAEHLPFADGRFDTVVSSLSTCTFVSPVAALCEMGRVCRPAGEGGRVLLMEHGRSNLAALGWWQDVRAAGHAQLVGCHWNRQPLDLVRQSGLTVLSSHRYVLGIYHVIVAAPTAPAGS